MFLQEELSFGAGEGGVVGDWATGDGDAVIQEIDPAGTDEGAEDRGGLFEVEQADHEGGVEAWGGAGVRGDHGASVAAVEMAEMGDATIRGGGSGRGDEGGEGVDAQDATARLSGELDGGGAFAAPQVEHAGGGTKASGAEPAGDGAGMAAQSVEVGEELGDPGQGGHGCVDGIGD